MAKADGMTFNGLLMAAGGFAAGVLTATLVLRHRLSAARCDARTDALTGLPNRRALDEYLQARLAEAERYGHGFSLVLFDLDQFKQINDHHGHAAGDARLRQVASIVRDALRASDFAARMGGDEFAIVCPGTTLEGATQLSQRLKTLLGQRSVSASFGCCTWKPGLPAAHLVELADTALLNQKQNSSSQSIDNLKGPGQTVARASERATD